MNWLFNSFPRDVVSAAGWTLLDSLWQGGIISVLLYLTLYLLRNKSANLKTLISVAALVLFVAAAIATFVTLSSSPGTESSYSGGYHSIHTQIVTLTNINDNTQKSTGEFFSALYYDAKEYYNNNVNYIFTLWLLGLSFFVIRFMGGMLLMMRTRKNANMIEESGWNNYIDKLCRKINLRKKVEMGESGYISVPVAMGFFKPVILFPFEILSGLPREQVEAIIAHEIAHIKRYDIFINLFQSAAEIIFFFNPFVWWISGRIRLEREFCCDDIAISQCGDELIYAKALANLESLVDSNMPLFAVPLFKNHNQLLRRINRMLQQDKNRNNFKEKFIAAVVFMGLLVSAAVFKNTNAQSAASGNNAAVIGMASAVENTGVFSIADFDSIKARKGTSKLVFNAEDNGKTNEYRVTIKNGAITSLKVNGEKIPKEDYGKYKTLIDKKVKEHEEAMAKHEIEMKQHEEQMKQHQAEMKEHDVEMKKHDLEMKLQQKQIDKDLKQQKIEYEKQMKKHEADMKQYEKDMRQHDQQMKQHEIDMQQHD
jgi:beta-lactamase regulating signal transducer with metallopeptidase domain